MKLSWMLGSVMLAAIGAPADSRTGHTITQDRPGAEDRTSSAVLTVIVLNKANISNRSREEILHHVDLILSQAGIRSEFVMCPTDLETPRPSICSELLRSDRILLQLLPGHPNRRVHAVGTSTVRRDDGTASIFLFPELAELMAGASGWSVPELLAHLIAHEIGHVLLGGSGHTSNGIMRAVWSPSELSTLRHPQAMFDRKQGNEMRAALGQRFSIAQATAGTH